MDVSHAGVESRIRVCSEKQNQVHPHAYQEDLDKPEFYMHKDLGSQLCLPVQSCQRKMDHLGLLSGRTTGPVSTGANQNITYHNHVYKQKVTVNALQIFNHVIL